MHTVSLGVSYHLPDPQLPRLQTERFLSRWSPDFEMLSSSLPCFLWLATSPLLYSLSSPPSSNKEKTSYLWAHSTAVNTCGLQPTGPGPTWPLGGKPCKPCKPKALNWREIEVRSGNRATIWGLKRTGVKPGAKESCAETQQETPQPLQTGISAARPEHALLQQTWVRNRVTERSSAQSHL